MKYLPRDIEQTVKKYKNIFSVIGITGPRQAGKSTMLRHILPEYEYVTFDDYEKIQLFHSDPEKFFSIYDSKVIFDEVQKVPEIFSWIKQKVDEDRENMGKYILTGSSQFGFIKGVNESLAGRIGMLSLLPLTLSEMQTDLIDETSFGEKSIYKGSYPEIVMRDFQFSDEWYDSYMNTYIERDIKTIVEVGNLRDFRRCVSLLAARIGQELNMASLSREIGVSVPTIKRWISALEASYIIFLLPPYFNNFGKRIVKNSKIYFYDTGLAAFLTGISEKELAEKGPLSGPIFENFIIADIKKNIFHTKKQVNMYYLRTNHGVEIDLILDGKNIKEFIEIKSSVTWKTPMTKTVEAFVEDGTGRLLYQGKTQKYLPNVFIQNYREFLMA
ncbi:AAA family ATPase [Candidatus Peregrinibacteria bacterium]|nr:MAG: AAA family ATPase [Candidatus Peregrinibacteria bacterium]